MNTEHSNSATGIADVMSSARTLAREARGLVEQAGCVAERELAMALSIAEATRDKVTSKEALNRARAQPLLHGLRTDAHRVVDLAFDAIASVYVFSVEFVDDFLDHPRPPIATPARATA